MTPTIFLGCPFPAGLHERLAPFGTVIGPFAPADIPSSPDIRILVTMGTQKTDVALMDRLPGLQLVCCYGSGYEGVDLAAARARGIMVAHSAGANAAAVADLAMALLLGAIRQIPVADQFVRDGRWAGPPPSRLPPVRGLTGRRVGVFGLGAIGEKIARRAAAFETEVAYHSRTRKPEAPWAWHPTLADLAGWADILMIAARSDATNRHVVSREVLAALGPEGIVVNIARGSLVDEAALIDLLEQGQLAAAGLDVFEREPLAPNALCRLPQVVLAPHIGGSTFDGHDAMQAMVTANVAAFVTGRAVPTPIPEMKD
jgi:glyoxylate reductase